MPEEPLSNEALSVMAARNYERILTLEKSIERIDLGINSHNTDIEIVKKCIAVHNGDVAEINLNIKKIDSSMLSLHDNFVAIKGGLTLAKWISAIVGFILVVTNLIVIFIYQI